MFFLCVAARAAGQVMVPTYGLTHINQIEIWFE
jgi:hypothetical protein